jgi:hypothetical protein
MLCPLGEEEWATWTPLWLRQEPKSLMVMNDDGDSWELQPAPLWLFDEHYVRSERNRPV